MFYSKAQLQLQLQWGSTAIKTNNAKQVWCLTESNWQALPTAQKITITNQITLIISYITWVLCQ